jgi:hypothetical protein
MNAELMDVGRSTTSPPPRPTAPAPPRTAPYETRAAWSERYVAWFLAQTPVAIALPDDVEPTHRYEVEFNSCVRDPQRYERMTREELLIETMH